MLGILRDWYRLITEPTSVTISCNGRIVAIQVKHIEIIEQLETPGSYRIYLASGRDILAEDCNMDLIKEVFENAY